MKPDARVLVALGVAAFAIGSVQVPFLLESDNGDIPPGIWAALTLFVGWGFVGAGLVAWWGQPENRTGRLMVFTGYLWFVGSLQGFEDPWVYSIASVFGAAFLGAAIHLLLAFPTGQLATRRERRVVIGTYFVCTVLLLPGALFSTPEDYDCTDCPENKLLVLHEPAVASISMVVVALLAIYVLAYTARVLLGRWRVAGPRWRAGRPVLAAGLVLIFMLSISLLGQLAGFEGAGIEAATVIGLAAFGLVPYIVLTALARVRFDRGGALSDLLAHLAETPGPGELRDALASALGDPGLMLAYPLPGSDRYVDAGGAHVRLPGASSGLVVNHVEHDGERVAAIVHDPSRVKDAQLARTVGRAAALALANERLEAQLRAKVDELRDSRMRLIEVGMAERRGLERNLHDGAQQRLISLALSMRMAKKKLRADPDGAEQLLDGAAGELDLALMELRELARGIHPAVLSDRGLPAALDSLAGRSPVPVRVARAPSDRLPEPVELAAYYVVSEALANVAKYSEASQATVQVARANGHVLVEVIDDGIGGADPGRGTGLRGLADRLRALEGRLDVHSIPGHGTIVKASIPCE